MNTPQQIKRLRQAAGMTLIELASEADVSKSFLSQFEAGNRGLRDATMIRLLNVLSKKLRENYQKFPEQLDLINRLFQEYKPKKEE